MSSHRPAPSCKYPIGQGSFGRVYKYSHNGSDYAVKKVTISPDAAHQHTLKAQRQAKILSEVTPHRNIVGYLSHGCHGGSMHLLTEYAPNGDLSQVTDLPPEDDLWEVVMQVAMALHHLRKHDIVHRDIKPQNILARLTRHHPAQSELVLKLADFGLAERVAHGGGLRGLAGSPLYMAPEVVTDKEYGFEVDIWSFGITLYQLAHGQRSPYHQEMQEYSARQQGKCTEHEMHKYLSGLIASKKISSSCPYPQINRLIESMLQHEPADRPTALQILKNPRVIERIILLNKSTEVANFAGQSMIAGDKIEESQVVPLGSTFLNPGKDSFEYTPSIERFMSNRMSISNINRPSKSEEVSQFSLCLSQASLQSASTIIL